MKPVPNELLEKYRHVHVEGYDWWDYLWEEEKEELEAMGFEAVDFLFSGFWYQGYGASFTGYVSDFEKFWPAFDSEPNNYCMLRKAEDVRAYLARHSSMYSHECTVHASVEAVEWQLDYGEDDPFKEALYEAWNEQLYRDMEEFENDLTRYMRDRMRDLYRRLEDEYDYLTSDEQVAEWVRECAPEELKEFQE